MSAGGYPRLMPARRSVRASLLWAALLAVLGLVGATPNALSQAAAGAGWSADIAAIAPAAVTADGPAAPSTSASPGTLSSASTAAPPIPTDLGRAWFDGRPPMVGQQQRSDHQLLALGAALGVLAVGAAWLVPGRGSAGRTPFEHRGGPGPRAPPRAPAYA